jgi:hypothetical protein
MVHKHISISRVLLCKRVYWITKNEHFFAYFPSLSLDVCSSPIVLTANTYCIPCYEHIFNIDFVHSVHHSLHPIVHHSSTRLSTLFLPPIYPPVCPPVCSPICPPVCPPVCPPFCPLICPPVCPLFCSPVCPRVFETKLFSGFSRNTKLAKMLPCFAKLSRVSQDQIFAIFVFRKR